MSSMNLPSILSCHGTEVTDADEEAFELFSHYNGASSLGMVDAKAAYVEITACGHDLTIKQSHGLLNSNREGGTTGAVLWSITPAFASWFASSDNFLFRSDLLNASAVVLELGAGISGIVGLCLAPLVSQYILTDQEYVLKLLKQNVEKNSHAVKSSRERLKRTIAKASDRVPDVPGGGGRLELLELDWEKSDASGIEQQLSTRPTVLVAADCIFNPAIIEPFVSTLADLSKASEDQGRPVLSVIAQQLRSPDVFTEWLEMMLRSFRVWRTGEEALQVSKATNNARLTVDNGFVVHICALRDDLVA